MSVPTPHISAKLGDFASTVLMPGDPLRSKFIAERYLTDARLVNNVRNVQGYTGFYKGKRISVMASGMGMPSMAIYSYELFAFYDVDAIIRVGSAGALKKGLKLKDVVIAEGAFTNSSFIAAYGKSDNYVPCPSSALIKLCQKTAEEIGVFAKTEKLFSSDNFYFEEKGAAFWAERGAAAVEMESAALFLNAEKTDKNALCLCAISDSLITKEELSATERETGFNSLIELALQTALRIG